MPALTAGFAELLDPSIRQLYIDTRKERPLEHPLWTNTSNMQIQNEKFQEMAGLGAMPEKPEGQQFNLDQALVGGTKTFSATSYGLAMEVSFEMWQDDLFGFMSDMAKELARSSRNRMEVNAHSVLNDAFDTGETGFDSTSLCSTSHTAVDGSTWSNRPSTDIELSVTGLQDAIQHFETMNNGRGQPMLMSPSLLIVAPNNRFVAREILGSNQSPFTANNEINSLIADDLRVMVNHYITTNTYWYVLAPKGEHDLHFKWMQQPIFDSFDDPRTKNAVFTVFQRHSDGWASARGIWGTTGS